MKKRLAGLMTLLICLCNLTDANPFPTLYFSGYSGVNYIEKIKYQGGATDFKQGYAVGASVGLRFLHFLRAEYETSFRENPFNKARRDGETLNLGGECLSWTFIGNFLIDSPWDWPVAPYLGVGYGKTLTRGEMTAVFNHLDQTVEAHMPIKGEDAVYQILGGLRLDLIPKTDVLLGYFYLDGKNFQRNHTFSFSLRRYF